MPGKIQYERVNLAEIETSSDEDDYGDLFAKERRNGGGKGRPLRHSAKKKGKCLGGGFCCRALCVVSTVVALLLVIAGAALYIDPKGSILTGDRGGNHSQDSPTPALTTSTHLVTQAGSQAAGTNATGHIPETSQELSNTETGSVNKESADISEGDTDTETDTEAERGGEDVERDSGDIPRSTWSSSVFVSSDQSRTSSSSQIMDTEKRVKA